MQLSKRFRMPKPQDTRFASLQTTKTGKLALTLQKSLDSPVFLTMGTRIPAPKSSTSAFLGSSWHSITLSSSMTKLMKPGSKAAAQSRLNSTPPAYQLMAGGFFYCIGFRNLIRSHEMRGMCHFSYFINIELLCTLSKSFCFSSTPNAFRNMLLISSL